jgi:hypothetical protein
MPLTARAYVPHICSIPTVSQGGLFLKGSRGTDRRVSRIHTQAELLTAKGDCLATGIVGILD